MGKRLDVGWFEEVGPWILQSVLSPISSRGSAELHRSPSGKEAGKVFHPCLQLVEALNVGLITY